MKRTAAAALAAVTTLALPATPASACSPSFGNLTAPARAAAGEDVRLQGEALVNWCDTGIGTETFTARPVPAPSALPVPGVTPPAVAPPEVTLPPLLPVAYAAPVRAEVEVTLVSFDGTERGAARRIAVVLADPAEPRASRHTFTATVRIPADVAPGRYLIGAKHKRDGVLFGERELTVTVARGLAATGGHTRDLTALALLAIVAGAGTLVVARRAS